MMLLSERSFKDWDPAVFSEEKEFVHGKLLVDAAKASSVKHFVYS